MAYLRLAKMKIDKHGYRNSQVYARAGDRVKVLREDGDVLIVEHCYSREQFAVNRSDVMDL